MALDAALHLSFADAQAFAGFGHERVAFVAEERDDGFVLRDGSQTVLAGEEFFAVEDEFVDVLLAAVAVKVGSRVFRDPAVNSNLNQFGNRCRLHPTGHANHDRSPHQSCDRPDGKLLFGSGSSADFVEVFLRRCSTVRQPQKSQMNGPAARALEVFLFGSVDRRIPKADPVAFGVEQVSRQEGLLRLLRIVVQSEVSRGNRRRVVVGDLRQFFSREAQSTDRFRQSTAKFHRRRLVA